MGSALQVPALALPKSLVLPCHPKPARLGEPLSTRACLWGQRLRASKSTVTFEPCAPASIGDLAQKSAAGNLPSKLSSPFLFSFHRRSTSQAQTLSDRVAPNPSFALLAQFTTVPPVRFNQRYPAVVLKRSLQCMHPRCPRLAGHSPICCCCCCARLNCKRQSPQAVCHQNLSMVSWMKRRDLVASGKGSRGEGQ